MPFTLSVILDSDEVGGDIAARIVKETVHFAKRGTVVVRTNDNKSVVMRHPLVGTQAGRPFIVYKDNHIWLDDVKTVEAYDPHPDWDMDADPYAGGI